MMLGWPKEFRDLVTHKTDLVIIGRTTQNFCHHKNSFWKIFGRQLLVAIVGDQNFPILALNFFGGSRKRIWSLPNKFQSSNPKWFDLDRWRVIEFLVCQKILSNSFSFRVLIDNQDWNLFRLDNQNSFVLGAGYFLGIAQTNSVANLAIENV